jgi:hypothetical protein
VSHSAGGIFFEDLTESLFGRIEGERMKQGDSPLEVFLNLLSALGRKMHGTQLFRGQLMLMMTLVRQGGLGQDERGGQNREIAKHAFHFSSRNRPAIKLPPNGRRAQSYKTFSRVIRSARLRWD